MLEAIKPDHFIAHELFNPGPSGPLVWRLRFGGSVLDAHLCDVGCLGFAYRLYINGRFTESERFGTEVEARRAVAGVRTRRQWDGWIEDASV